MFSHMQCCPLKESFEDFDKVSNGANCVVRTEDIVCLSGKGPGVVQPGAKKKKKKGGGAVARSTYVFPLFTEPWLSACMSVTIASPLDPT